MVQRLNGSDPLEVQYEGLLTANLSGRLWMPHEARGIVVFVDDRGLGCSCPRQRAIAQEFGALGLATLRVDLLGCTEARQLAATPEMLITILGARLSEITAWLQAQPLLSALPLGYFGLGLGATAALEVAASNPAVRGVVIQHGLLKLAPEAVATVQAPTLVLVNEDDFPQLSRYQTLLSQLAAPHRLRWLPYTTPQGQPIDPVTAIANLGGAWLQHFLTESSSLQAP